MASRRSAYVEATELLAYWQQKLGLQSWRIGVVISHVLPVPDSEAAIEIVWENEVARLTILHPDSYEASCLLEEQDIERAVVHELIHIVLDPIEPKDRQSLDWRVFEAAVDRLARAMVAARRERKRSA